MTNEEFFKDDVSLILYNGETHNVLENLDDVKECLQEEGGDYFEYESWEKAWKAYFYERISEEELLQIDDIEFDLSKIPIGCKLYFGTILT